MSKRVLVVISETPWPPNSGGRIDFYFKLRALRQIGVKLIVIFAYSCERDMIAFAEQADLLCEGWYAFPRKKGLFQALNPVMPYYLSANKPNTMEEAGISDLLGSIAADIDVIVMDHLNSYFIAKTAIRCCKNAKVVYRMHNIEADFLFSVYTSLPASSLRKWLLGMDFLRMRRIEKKLLREFEHVACISKTERDVVHAIVGKGSVAFWVPPFFDFAAKRELSDEEETTFRALKERFSNKPVLFFAGNFFGGANVEAARWFINDVLPTINRSIAVDFIVGGHKADEFFTDDPVRGVSIYSDFSSAKPFMAIADVVLVLTRSHGGVKLKLMEALSFGKRIVSTVEGVKGSGLEDVISASNDPAAFASNVISELQITDDRGESRHDFFARHFDPLRNARNLIEGCVAT